VVTAFLIQKDVEGLGRPPTRPEAIDVVTFYLLTKTLDCEPPPPTEPATSGVVVKGQGVQVSVEYSARPSVVVVSNAGKRLGFQGITNLTSVSTGNPPEALKDAVAQVPKRVKFDQITVLWSHDMASLPQSLSAQPRVRFQGVTDLRSIQVEPITQSLNIENRVVFDGIIHLWQPELQPVPQALSGALQGVQ
jgi:hypothetical protein